MCPAVSVREMPLRASPKTAGVSAVRNSCWLARYTPLMMSIPLRRRVIGNAYQLLRGRIGD